MPGPEYQKTIPGTVSKFVGDNVPFLAAAVTGPFAPAVIATQMSESAYSQEHDKSYVAAKKAHPDWTEAQLQDCSAQGRDRCGSGGFENGIVMSFLHVPKLGGPITAMIGRLGCVAPT